MRRLTRTSQRFLLIDEETAREVFSAIGHEFIPTKFERVQRLVRLCGEVDSVYSVGDGSVRKHGPVRPDEGVGIRNAVRYVSVTNRGRDFIIEKANSNGRHDARKD